MSYQIEFAASTGRKITLEVGGHESIENLRDKLEPFVGVSIEHMTFFYNGQQVIQDHPFLEYNIESGGSMMLVCDDDQSVDVSGATNTGNFRENIKKGIMPQKGSVDFKSVVSEFVFQSEAPPRDISSLKILPQCSFAKLTNPVSDTEELYMSVGLNTNTAKTSVRLPNFNSIVLLDSSSSMLEPLNKNESNTTSTKHTVSKESIFSLLSSLHPENNFGIVTFDEKLQILQPMSLVGSGTELVDLKEKVLSINSTESCDIRAGFDGAVELIHPFASKEKENRVIVITDKIPNHPNDFELLKNISEAASQRIYTTIIAVGKHITKSVRKEITKIKGANFVEILSSSDASRLSDEIEALLIPLAFDLSVKITSEDLSIEEVYGATLDKESGLLINVATLFPTLQDDNNFTKGEIILLKLKPTSETLALHPTLQLSLSYEMRDGEKQTQVDKVDASQLVKDVFGSNKIRKAITLAVYVKCLQSWVNEGIASAAATRSVQPKKEITEDGEEVEENQKTGNVGIPLKFSPAFADDFFELREYVLKEANKLMDPSLDREVDVLSFLLEKVVTNGKVYFEPQSQPDTCFPHAINMYFQKQYIDDEFLTLYCELLRSSALMVTKLKNSGAKASCYGQKAPNEKFLHDDNSDPLYDEDLFAYFEIYKAMQVEDFIQDITKDKLKELSPIQALFLLEFSMSILPSAGGGVKALLYYTPHSFLHRYSRSTSERDQARSQKRFCDSAKVSPKMFLCHIENGKSHAFAAMNQIVPSIRSPSLTSSAEIYATPVRPALNLSGIPQTPVATPSSTPRPSTPTSTTPRGTSYQTTPPGSTSTTPRGDNSTPRGDNNNNNSATTTPRRGSTATTPRGDNNDNTTITPGDNTAPTRRDSTAIPFDLEIVSNQPPVPPSKSVWSTIFGFAFGPFASCVFPQSCAPKYEEKNEPNNIKTESMTSADSKISPNNSNNNSGRSSPVTTNGNTENGEYISSTPPKNDQLQKQPDAEELEWLLLDSLVGTGMIVPDLKTMFSTYFYGGRASVAILPDTQREPILIGRKNINLHVNK